MVPVQSSHAVTVSAFKNMGCKAAACKTVGTGVTGKGICLGLGLGMGVWGPIALVGIGVATGYFYYKKVAEMLD